ncbi:MAG: nitrate reductase cytochrome c-type subunit [Helicobacter sp.]|nr:nitrate reductase cytochrome c-type subunit [Helicobacteraceae bacterium]MDY3113926.1 nitrate reductase cytochrome c-type subunit [Helicobacter sp.]
MNLKKTLIASLALSGLVFLGCSNSVSDNEIGLRKSTLFSEELQIVEFDYNGVAAGESKLIERAFENAPPMISHTTDGMLPITKEANSCLDCHTPDVAAALNATAIPQTHFVELSSGKAGGKMQDTRFNCVLCHATQVNAAPLVKNNFDPKFRDGTSAKKSNLIDILNEGVE